MRDEIGGNRQFAPAAVDQGSDVKWLLSAGEVAVNGEMEVRRGRQLVEGDLVEYAGTTYRVVPG